MRTTALTTNDGIPFTFAVNAYVKAEQFQHSIYEGVQLAVDGFVKEHHDELVERIIRQTTLEVEV